MSDQYFIEIKGNRIPPWVKKSGAKVYAVIPASDLSMIKHIELPAPPTVSTPPGYVIGHDPELEEQRNWYLNHPPKP